MSEFMTAWYWFLGNVVYDPIVAWMFCAMGVFVAIFIGYVLNDAFNASVKTRDYLQGALEDANAEFADKMALARERLEDMTRHAREHQEKATRHFELYKAAIDERDQSLERAELAEAGESNYFEKFEKVQAISALLLDVNVLLTERCARTERELAMQEELIFKLEANQKRPRKK